MSECNRTDEVGRKWIRTFGESGLTR
jgi:hypothetical protein